MGSFDELVCCMCQWGKRAGIYQSGSVVHLLSTLLWQFLQFVPSNIPCKDGTSKTLACHSFCSLILALSPKCIASAILFEKSGNLPRQTTKHLLRDCHIYSTLEISQTFLRKWFIILMRVCNLYGSGNKTYWIFYNTMVPPKDDC